MTINYHFGASSDTEEIKFVEKVIKLSLEKTVKLQVSM